MKTKQDLEQRIVCIVVIFSLREVRIIAANAVQVPMVHNDSVSTSWLRNIIAYNVLNSGVAVVVRFNFCEAQIFSSCGHCNISLFNVIITQITTIIVKIRKQTVLIQRISIRWYTWLPGRRKHFCQTASKTSQNVFQLTVSSAENVIGVERADLPLRRSSPFCCIPLHAPAIFQWPLRSNQFSSHFNPYIGIGLSANGIRQ